LTEKAIKQYISFAKTQLRDVKEKKQKKKIYNFFRLISEAKRIAKNKKIIVFYEKNTKKYSNFMDIRNNTNNFEFDSSEFQNYLSQTESLLDQIDQLKPWKALSSLNSLKSTSIWLDEWLISYRSFIYLEDNKQIKN
jgi:hypothetical protein